MDYRSFCTVGLLKAEENLSSTAIYLEFDDALQNYRIAGVLFDRLARIGAGH